MKPKLLKISGLNSFVEEQTINFSTLIEKGLFGIFGPTGSGKSTILDAITIALYGYNAIARGTKEFINTDLDKVYVGYEFDCNGNKGREAYRIERSIKKNKTGGIKTDFARLSFLDDGGNVIKIIDKVSQIDKEVKRIIGLNHQDFTRSVVLPQGKFSEFLKLSGSDRRNMLERILGLEQYGGKLMDKIRSYKKTKEAELQVLNGELNRFEGVTEENLKALKEELSLIEKKENALKSEINIIEKRYEKLSEIWRLQSELNGYLVNLGDLNKQTSEIENTRIRWQRANSSKSVKPYLDRYNDTLEAINKNKGLLKDILLKIKGVDEELNAKELKYKDIYENKERRLPILIEKEANIKNAIELVKSVQKLAGEKKELAKEFNTYTKIIKKSQEDIKKLKINISSDNTQIEELEIKSKELKVSPEYRQKLTKAWELKNTYDGLKKDEKNSLKTIKELTENILSSKDEFSKISKALKEREKEHNEIKTHIEKLDDKPPKDNDYILSKELELQKLKLTLEEGKENFKKKAEIQEELKLICKNKNETKIKVDYLQKRLKSSIKKLENAKKEIDELEKSHRASLLSANLTEGDPCPVCGSYEHPRIAQTIDYSTIEKIIKIRDGFEENKRDIDKAIYELEIELKKDVKEENKHKEELNKYIGKLKNIDIAKLEEQILDLAKKINNDKTYLKNWENKRNELTKALELKEKEKIDLEKQSIRFTEGIKKDKTRLDEENKRKEELIKELEEASKIYTKAKSELNIDNIDAEMKKVTRNEKELESIDKKLIKLRNDFKIFNAQKEELEEKLNEVKLKRSRVEEIGKEKRKFIDEYNDKIKKVVKDKEPKAYLKEVQEKKSSIIEKEETLRKTIEEDKKILNRLNEKKAGLENTNKTLEQAMDSIEKDLKEALKENKFESVDEVKAYLITNEEIKLMEEKIAKYDNEISKLRHNIDRIKAELKGASLEEKDFSQFKEDMKNKKQEYNLLIEEIGKKKERIKETENNFNKVKEISEKIKKLQHITDMLNEMFKLVSGNKFVEYVATSHLRYIAKEASKRLIDITNKRYSLELDSNGNFVICDNFNGGVRRDCNTLSGGETFLTSLALALSLSSQIQLKGNASIEFFFLDEGFGTLDSHLLDTVMTSLERLHQENLAVGIISHVEELKSRVPVKLLVTPSESGLYGTKVAIERN